MKKLLLIAIAVVSVAFNSVSQSGASLQFVENRGQWNADVKFKGELPNGAFFLTSSGVTIVQHNEQDLQQLSKFYHGTLANPPAKITVRSHAYSMAFTNADINKVTAEQVTNTNSNYLIGNDPSKWATNCKTSEVVTFKNIYPNIDAKYYTVEGKVKYDLVLKPGANIGDIEMRYTGVEAIKISGEELIVKTSLGEIKELSPYSYQMENGKEKEVKCRFKISGNTVKFEAGEYAKNKTLTIDPTLVFSTLTGSSADNWGYTATYGSDGSFYAGGIVFGSGFPTSIGAFNTVYNGGISDQDGIGGYDIGIIKFSPDGKERLYATYIGGSANEEPLSILADQQGNLVVAARTNSTNYPTTSPALGTLGQYDIAITRLNAAGNGLVGSRKIGGSGNDGVNIRQKYIEPFESDLIRRQYGDDSRSDIAFDNNGNIILASCTQSQNFPVTDNAFQITFGGRQDGVVIKLSADFSNVIFSSFIGGDLEDAAFTLAYSPVNNNIYIAGNTANSALPGDKTNVLSGSYNGGVTDGFLSMISSNGSSLIKTTYIGTAGNDVLYGIDIDQSGFPYITGTTTGSWPLVNAPYSQTGGKQFIAKLQPDLSGFVYSTVFGTNSVSPNILPVAFTVDYCENVYVSGWGGEFGNGEFELSGTIGLSVTQNAVKASTDNKDFYFFVLEKNAASQLYGSFFGQDGGLTDHVDGGRSRITKQGILYQAVCANCGRDVPFPTTPGTWSPTNGSASCNQAAVKVDLSFCTATLPVRLAGFSGRISNNFHELKWQVFNEQARDTYVIEQKGSIPETFTSVYNTKAELDKANNSYSIQLPAPAYSETFYRLKIISVTGAVSYSPLVLLTDNKKTVFKSFISQNNLYIRYPANTVGVALYTADGKLLLKQSITGNNNIMSIPLDKFQHGTILVKLQLPNNVLATKVIY